MLQYSSGDSIEIAYSKCDLTMAEYNEGNALSTARLFMIYYLQNINRIIISCLTLALIIYFPPL